MVNHDLDGALRDISSIRRIMSQVAGSRGNPLSATHSTNTTLMIHVFALIFSGALLIQELGVNPFARDGITLGFVLNYSVTSNLMRALLVVATGAFLATLCLGLYAILWTAARREQEDFSSYLARNFRPYSALSFLSDLLVKFSGVAMIIATGHPEWLSPFLLLCTADYLFQGRFFHLPLLASVGGGLVSLTLSGVQVYTQVGDLAVAISSFVALTTLSLAVVVSRKRSLEGEGESEGERHG